MYKIIWEKADYLKPRDIDNFIKIAEYTVDDDDSNTITIYASKLDNNVFYRCDEYPSQGTYWFKNAKVIEV